MHIEFTHHKLFLLNEMMMKVMMVVLKISKSPWNQFVAFFFFRSSPRKTSQVQRASPLVLRDTPQSSSSSAVAMETDVKCRVCDVPADARFEPCGHVIACMECAAMLKKCFLCKVMFCYDIGLSSYWSVT